MTEQEQQIAVARFCGYEWSTFANQEIICIGKNLVGSWVRCDPPNDIRDGYAQFLPNYLHSLDAIQEAVMRLPSELHIAFNLQLHQVVMGVQPNHECNDECLFRTQNATAAQRTKALLKTVGLWKE